MNESYQSASGTGEWCVSRAHCNMVQLITRPPSLRDRDHCVESLDLSLSANMANNNMNEQEQLTSTVLVVGRRWYTCTTSPLGLVRVPPTSLFLFNCHHIHNTIHNLFFPVWPIRLHSGAFFKATLILSL